MPPSLQPVPTTRKLAVLAALCAVTLAGLPAQAQDPLTFFKNYFVTGDYLVRGVSLWRKGVNGTAVAQIPAINVPPQTDVLAAFLYVQTAESVQGSGINHATFDGFDLGPWIDPVLLTPGSGTYAKPLVDWATAMSPCWAVNFPGGRKLMTYRADVMRFLPVDAQSGKYKLNAPITVTVPDAGVLFPDDDETTKGETVFSPLPRAIGASLVVVYRDPLKPLSAVVIYDGAYVKRALAKMVQPIRGFYEASTTSPFAAMTPIVGNGRPWRGEQVLLGSAVIARNPFTGTDGPRWDDVRFNNLPLPGDAASTSVTIAPAGLLPACLCVSALAFRTTVQDTDGDGLLDVWEKQTSAMAPLLDPHGNALPNLGDMGASPTHKDLFAEIAYMTAADGTTYGGVARPVHTHLPTQNALKLAADAFNQAPVNNPDGSTGIKVHFDVGNNYQNGAPYIVPAAVARGGKSISETQACPQLDASGNVIPTAPPIECKTASGSQGDIPGQYPKYPGTVGWKTGFQMLRDAILGFDFARKDIFHYVLFAHSIGMPKEPCQNADGTSNFTCQDTNPDFHVPRTNSGIADYPGGDVMVTLGAFLDDQLRPVGTEFMQGSTLMHELGHNFELRHGGPGSLDPTKPPNPNCNPPYLSVMNYLYQLRGLPDVNGIVRMDFSAQSLDPLNEDALHDDALTPLNTARYRPGWYAPWNGSYLQNIAKPALKHCNGTDLLTDANGNPTEVPMVRVDAFSPTNPVDWNANGVLNAAAFTQDINFDGQLETVLSGADDWDNVHLNQLGGRRNVGGYYFVPPALYAVGPLSLNVGRGDIGRGDIGRGDIGRGDIGNGDIGRGDIGIPIGRGDIGRGDIGRGDIGRGDIGRGDIGSAAVGRGDIGRGDIGRGVFGLGDLDVGGANDPGGDIDLATALAVTGTLPTDPPNSPAKELTACLTTGGQCAAQGGDVPVLLQWQAPHLGQAVSYSIFRFTVNPNSIFPPATLPSTPIGTVSGDGPQVPPPTSYADGTAIAGQTYAYFVVANFGAQVASGISNFAVIATPSGNGSVQGRVIDATGAVLPGVTVTIVNDSTQASSSVLTDAVGVFLFPSLPPGTYTFTAPASVTGSFTLAAGQALNLGDLGPGGTVSISSVVPAQAAPGFGQTIAVMTVNAPAGTPAATFTQGQASAQGFVLPGPSTQDQYFVRLPLEALSPGLASVRLVFGQVSTADVPLTVSTTPGTPQARFVLSGTCGNMAPSPITSVIAGQAIGVSAYGIDTQGAVAVFTQNNVSTQVQASCATSNGAIGLAGAFTVPANLALGLVTVQIKTSVNGIESALSNALTLTVVTPIQ